MADNCKFQKTQRQYSEDSGTTWYNVVPAQYSKGELLEYDSSDCTSIETMYRWRVLNGQYLCDGNSKYTKEIQEESYNNGVTWYTSFPTIYRGGEYVGQDAEYCCDKFVGHYIYDPSSSCASGYYWDGVKCVKKSSGSQQPIAPGGGSLWFRYKDPLKIIKCDGNGNLASADTKYYTNEYVIYNADIGDSVTNINSNTFYGCTGLTDVEIGTGITSIGDNAFSGCSSLSSMTINASTPPTLGSNVFSGTNLKAIYVPCNNVIDYRTADGWSDYSMRIKGTPPCDGEPVPTAATKFYATYSQYTDYTTNYKVYFKYCDSDTNLSSGDTHPQGYYDNLMKTAVIGNCCSSIGYGAFSGCYGLISCTIGSGVTSIGSGAFWYCSSLTSITVDSNNANYSSEDGVLFNKTKTTLIQYPIGSSRTSYTIPNSVTSIGYQAFQACSGLTSIDIPSGVTSIGNYAFSRCSGLTSCTIGSGVTSIGNGAFNVCHGLTSIVIPSGSIGQSAFQQCTGLTTCTIGSGVTSIDLYAFYGCSGLTSIDIPDSVTSIGMDAFRYCSSLTSCTIGSGVTSIGIAAFQDCTGLTSITINAITPPTLGWNAFDNTGNSPIFVPSQSLETYKSASSRWSSYASRIQPIT